MKPADPNYLHERRFLPLFSAHQIARGLGLTDDDARRLMDETETVDSEGIPCQSDIQAVVDEENSKAIGRLVDPEAQMCYAFGKARGEEAFSESAEALTIALEEINEVLRPKYIDGRELPRPRADDGISAKGSPQAPAAFAEKVAKETAGAMCAAVADFDDVSDGAIRLSESPIRSRPRQLLDRFIWYLKQLLPLTYRKTYGEGGRKHFTVWRMWFGRCFDVEDVLVADPFEPGDGVDHLAEVEAELKSAGISADETWRDFSELQRGDLAAILTHQGNRMGAYDGHRFYRWAAAAYALGRMDGDLEGEDQGNYPAAVARDYRQASARGYRGSFEEWIDDAEPGR